MNFDEIITKKLKEVCNNTFPVNAYKDVKTPYIVYDAPETVEDKTLEGYINSYRTEVDIYIVCETFTEVKDKTRQVIQLIKNMEMQDVEGVYFEEITFSEYNDQFYDKESKTYVHVLNVIFYY